MNIPERFLYLIVILQWLQRSVSFPERLVVYQSQMTDLLVVKARLGDQDINLALNFTDVESQVYSPRSHLAFVQGYDRTRSASLRVGEYKKTDLMDWYDASDTLLLGSRAVYYEYPFKLVKNLPPTSGYAIDVAGVLSCSPYGELGADSLLIFESTSYGYMLRVVADRYLSQEFTDGPEMIGEDTISFITRTSMHLDRKPFHPAVQSGWIMQVPYILADGSTRSNGARRTAKFFTYLDLVQEGIIVHEDIAMAFLQTVIHPSLARRVLYDDEVWMQCEPNREQSYFQMEVGGIDGVPVKFVDTTKREEIFFRNKLTGQLISRLMCRTVIRVTWDPKYTKLVSIGRMFMSMTSAIVLSGRESQILFKFNRAALMVDDATIAAPNSLRKSPVGPPLAWLPVEPFVPTYKSPLIFDHSDSAHIQFPKDLLGRGEWVLVNKDISVDQSSGVGRLRFLRHLHEPTTRQIYPLGDNFCWGSWTSDPKFSSFVLSIKKAAVGQQCALCSLRIESTGNLIEVVVTPVATMLAIEQPRTTTDNRSPEIVRPRPQRTLFVPVDDSNDLGELMDIEGETSGWLRLREENENDQEEECFKRARIG